MTPRASIAFPRVGAVSLSAPIADTPPPLESTDCLFFQVFFFFFDKLLYLLGVCFQLPYLDLWGAVLINIRGVSLSVSIETTNFCSSAMDEYQSGEETSFVVDEITTIIKESQINLWSSSIVESSLNQLTKLGKPFKYIVTCILLQKNGAGLHTASSCFWDNTTDGSCTVRWENKTMYCIVSVFGLAI
ncbi:dynein light chain Tctex-type 1 isoform X2 [Misgurnus anguillicaudatus]|uniref:dynein light chain Tctex-type 1 isoform X2 n=1 Tax=Misgurnus anguillicaudatus TaxID=75329 RepID=UPI003CCFDEB0